MDCESVFEILTRGPFPTGDVSDGAVEAHILRCPDCRRLAEALRPADDVEQESVDSEESLALPGYWSHLSSGGTEPVVSLGQRVRPASVRRRKPADSQRPQREIVVPLMIGAALCIVFAALAWGVWLAFFVH